MSTDVVDQLPKAEFLVTRASAFVYDLLKEKLPDEIVYHSYEHTLETAKAAEKIGGKVGLSGEEQLLVTLAAWFHDTGYVDGAEGHEERSAEIATQFLGELELPDDDIATVEALIRSTHPDHEPGTRAEKVLHDADIIHVGKKKKFFRYSERLRREWELLHGHEFTESEWVETQLRFLAKTQFKTDYGKKRYGDVLKRNIGQVQEKLADLMNEQRPVPTAAVDRRSPARGIETMFRNAYRVHINLSAIADSKANIMISINAILMSIIVSFVSTRIQADPETLWLMIPATAMLLTSLIAIIFAILGARPKVTSKVFTLSDVRRNRANILFFGNFVNIPLEEFRDGMHELMADWDRLYNTMINDLYALGQVLQRKYRLLWISYSVFMAGLIVTVALFGILYFNVT